MGWERADSHRQRRLPDHQPGRAAQGAPTTGVAVPLAPRRGAAVPHPGGRRRPASTASGSTSSCRSTSAWPPAARARRRSLQAMQRTTAWAGRSRRDADAARPAPVRHRAGRASTPSCGASTRRSLPPRVSRLCGRGFERGGGAQTDAGGGGGDGSGAADGSAPVSDGRRACRRTSSASLAWDTTCSTACCRRATGATACCFTARGRVNIRLARYARDAAADRPDLRLLRLPDRLARLPAPPGVAGEMLGAQLGELAQPAFLPRPDGARRARTLRPGDYAAWAAARDRGDREQGRAT